MQGKQGEFVSRQHRRFAGCSEGCFRKWYRLMSDEAYEQRALVEAVPFDLTVLGNERTRLGSVETKH
jgi:hypothetical protein